MGRLGQNASRISQTPVSAWQNDFALVPVDRTLTMLKERPEKQVVYPIANLVYMTENSGRGEVFWDGKQA